LDCTQRNPLQKSDFAAQFFDANTNQEQQTKQRSEKRCAAAYAPPMRGYVRTGAQTLGVTIA
jgi:hypothetical protein